MKVDIFAIRLFINGKRKKSHELTKRQAQRFLMTAKHLERYLKKEYKVCLKDK